MTQVIVDEALLREPNLWVPGKKPVGHIKIDLSHPLSDDLIAFLPLRSYPVTHELVTNKPQVDLSGSGLAGYTRIPGTQYSGFLSDSLASTQVSIEARQDLDIVGADITCLCGVYINRLDQDIALFGLDTDQNPSSWLDTSGGNLRVSAFTQYSTTNISSTGYWTGGVRWFASGAVDFVNEGVVTDSTTQTLTIPSNAHLSAFSTTGSSVTKGLERLATNNGIGVWWAFWARALSNDEIFSMTNDPFQVVIPA